MTGAAMCQVLILIAVAYHVQIVVGAHPETICSKTESYCSDCNTVMICVNGRLPLNVACSGDVPFCNEGICSKTPQSGIDCPLSAFNCPTQNGVYPDATDCSVYHLCVNLTSYDYDCSPSEYSVKTKTCSLPPSTCKTVNCSGLNGVWRAHPDDPQIMFFCIHGNPTIVDVCPENLVYNNAKQRCVFQCNNEGPNADPEDPTKFYECIRRVDIDTTNSTFVPYGRTDKLVSRYEVKMDEMCLFEFIDHEPNVGDDTSNVYYGIQGDTKSFTCSKENIYTDIGGYSVQCKINCYDGNREKNSESTPNPYHHIHRDCPEKMVFNVDKKICT